MKNTFAELQKEFLNQLVYSIKFTLQDKEIDEEKIYDITDSLVFSIASLIDGSAECGEEENPFISFLTFNRMISNPEELIVSLSGSYLHEISVPLVQKICGVNF